jgi:NAD(P)-dependent dehydrogenase (short-subunit alcohol dehydrogenase family)
MNAERVVVITGGGTHLGRAAAARLADPSAMVVLASRNRARCQAVADELARTTGPCEALECDVTDESSVHALFERVASDHGRLDVVVCSAGGSRTSTAGLMAEIAEVEATIRLNLLGSYLCAREAAAQMRPDRGGALVLVASIHGTVAGDRRVYQGIEGFVPSGPAYHAAKGGVVQLTRSLAASLGPSGIRVNCVSPGMVPTADTPLGLVERYVAGTPLGRVGRPEDVADAIAFLAGTQASWITGQNLVVDGGWTIW